MRYGFFHGVEGDPAALEAALALLADCDRIVCLGGLLGGEGPVDGCVVARLDRLICLGGPAERRRARDAALPAAVRERLRALPDATVVDGIAVMQPPRRRGRGQAPVAPDGMPRLVAPLAVFASAGGTRLWRAAGGLGRVEALEPGARAALGRERVRLDLGPARREGGGVQVAVIDRAMGVVELRTGRARARVLPAPLPLPRRRPALRRRQPVAEGQLRLAV